MSAREDEHRHLGRRGFLGACATCAALAFSRSAGALPAGLPLPLPKPGQKPKPKTPPPPPPLRLAWPWPVHSPDPYAANDLVAALVGLTLFPPLYVRAIDGYIEPKLAMGAPKEKKPGVRVDLAPYIRPSDVVASIARARSGGARLLLRDVPVPRIDGQHGVLFPFVGDIDGLMRKLATPMAGIARMEPRRMDPTGVYDFAVEERGPAGSIDGTIDPVRLLRLHRRNVWGLPVPGIFPNRIQRFELEGPIDLRASLRAFEDGDTDLAWLGDGLFDSRPGARTIDLGPLAYLGLRVGNEAPELQHGGGALGVVEWLPSDRLAHLGLLRRGLVAPTNAGGLARSAPSVGPNTTILARANMPMLVAAAEILAHDLGVKSQAIEDGAMDAKLADGNFALALDVVRAIDDTEMGAAISLATFDHATSAPAAGVTLHAVASGASAALGWEIALVGAQAADVWIPRASLGGLDLEGGAEASV